MLVIIYFIFESKNEIKKNSILYSSLEYTFSDLQNIEVQNVDNEVIESVDLYQPGTQQKHSLFFDPKLVLDFYDEKMITKIVPKEIEVAVKVDFGDLNLKKSH